MVKFHHLKEKKFIIQNFMLYFFLKVRKYKMIYKIKYLTLKIFHLIFETNVIIEIKII